MNEQSSDKDRLQDDEKLTAQLMRMAGPRAEIPRDVESRVYDRVLDEWTADNQRSSKSGIYQDVEKSWRRGQLRARLFRWVTPILVAASAAYIVVNMSEPDALPAPAVGSIAMATNMAERWPEGQPLHAGETITTGAGQGLSILMAGKESLRLDQNSMLRIDGREQFTLLKGRVYADTGQLMYRDGGLVISAGFATVTDVGTQFAVSLEGSELLVSVREG
jgi:ferric-dicitrate binding protein FerR (iron transport regulator)